MDKTERRPLPVRILQCLFLGYFLTVLLLFLLAFLLYRMQLSEKAVSAGIMMIYLAASFLSGFMAGRKAGSRKFLWGLVQGILYFVVLLVVTLITKHAVSGLGRDLAVTFTMCAGAGMLGGMLS